MKIKKFNESDEIKDISPDRVDEIIENLSSTISDLDKNNKQIRSYMDEISDYLSSKDNNENDQLDDSKLAMELISDNLEENITKYDTIIKNLQDYNENGRKFLY